MPLFKNIFLKLFCFTVCLTKTVNIISQPCGGSWALQRPLTEQCVSGQWIGWQNGGNPLGCPVNPVYVGVQTNTFTFTNMVNTFSIDFLGFDGAILCARIEIKVNGIFYPLTASNISDLPSGSTCTGSFSNLSVTPDGYLIIGSSGGAFTQGRITINNMNVSSVSVSTNDGSGTVFSNPFNCITVPLKLESFTWVSKNCKTLLNWKTGIEQNVKNIEVERSEDGILFYKVGDVIPKGSNSQYYFETANAVDAYFKLKINDLDGYYEYSEIMHIKPSCNDRYYAINPTPTGSVLKVTGLTNGDRLLVFDMAGVRVFALDYKQSNNTFDIHSLPTGMYVVQVLNAGIHKGSLKLIKN